MNVVTFPTPEEDPRDAHIKRLEQQLEHERSRIKAVLIDLENLEMERRVERRAMSAMKTKLKALEDGERAPHISAIREVFEYWRERCKGGNQRVVLGEKREKVIAARLKDGYTVDELCRAIDGAAAGAYVDEKGKRHDDIELICRDEVKVDSFIARAPAETSAAAAPEQVMMNRQVDRAHTEALARLRTALTEHFGMEYDIPDRPHGFEIWPCPRCTTDDQLGDYYPLTLYYQGKLGGCQSCGVSAEALLTVIEEDQGGS